MQNCTQFNAKCKIICLGSLLISLQTFAGPGDGINFRSPLGPLVFHPFISFGVRYDTNVRLNSSGQEKDDFIYEGKAGISMDSVEIGIIDLGASVYYFIERYNKASDLNNETFGFDFDIGINENFEKMLPTIWDMKLNFHVGYDETQDVDYETGEIESKRNFTYGASAAKLFGFGEVKLAADYNNNNFGSVSSSQPVYDYHTATYSGTIYPKLTEKTSGILTYDYTKQGGDGVNGSAHSTSGRVGLQSKRTDKTTISFTVGYLDHNKGGNTIAYTVGADWKATEKITVSLSGNNTIVPSISSSNNYSTSYKASLSANYKMSSKISGSWTLNYNREDVKNNVTRTIDTQTAVTGKLKSDTWRTALQLNYNPRSPLWTLFGNISYETRDSSFQDNNYDETMVFTGLQLTY